MLKQESGAGIAANDGTFYICCGNHLTDAQHPYLSNAASTAGYTVTGTSVNGCTASAVASVITTTCLVDGLHSETVTTSARVHVIDGMLYVSSENTPLTGLVVIDITGRVLADINVANNRSAGVDVSAVRQSVLIVCARTANGATMVRRVLTP